MLPIVAVQNTVLDAAFTFLLVRVLSLLFCKAANKTKEEKE